MRAHMSQSDLARSIREAGFRSGDTNACTREMVQRWESGRTRRPQGRYLIALERVLGQPAENLGFDADLKYGRARALGVPDGRAAVEPGREAAGADAGRGAPYPAAHGGFHHLRHARPGRGHDHGRPGHRHAGRHFAAGRYPADPLRPAGQRSRGRLHRLRSPRTCTTGASARARGRSSSAPRR